MVRQALYVVIGEPRPSDPRDGALFHVVSAFDSSAVVGRVYEAAIVRWSARDPDLGDGPEELRKRLVDWLNLEVHPRLRNANLLIWF
ncbi:hypothetical protein KIKIMORA_04430 [Brevundimonas phage vB_BpoS-Kikimora]|uniref:Uncharacterized protein n=1 Tax=Brevundimonas phage vB_BpoS-Kikimora TaxID=2948601 RepID=A0A9E7MTV2_9CAUD|nr:hypothetical protein KIKIMORA_04430 [Brevundimonas phage vB_BpoS-Kikimora]